MSITTTKFSISFIVCAATFFSAFSVSAQQIEARIKIDRDTTIIAVEGENLRGNSAAIGKNWSFANSATSAEIPDERVSDFHLRDEQKGHAQ